MSSDDFMKPFTELVLQERKKRPAIIQHAKIASKPITLKDLPPDALKPFTPLTPDQIISLRLTSRSPAIDSNTIHSGECHCGQVALEFPRSLIANSAGYCHCADCRISHACLLYGCFYFGVSDVNNTPIYCVKGDELIKYYHSGSNVRAFCSNCGTRIFNVGMIGVGSFPSIFNSFPFNPTCHLYYGECRTRELPDGYTCEFPDGLPKVLDMFAEVGGSGLQAID